MDVVGAGAEGAGADEAWVSLVAEQAAAIARLEARVAELEAERGGEPSHSVDAVPPWGTPGPDQVGGAHLPPPDAQVVHDAGVDDDARPAWGTPGRDQVNNAHLPVGAQVVHDAGVDDRVDGGRAVRGMQDRHVGRGEGLSTAHDEGSDVVRSTAAEVEEVCQEITSGWWQGSAPVWLSGYAWRVLDVVGTRALLLADRVVGTRPYHYEQVAVTWRDCSLRRWLNDEFCASLGEALVSRVLTAKVCNEPNPVWGTRGGRDTKDQIFLLSMREAAVHFTGKEPDVWGDYRHTFFSLGEKGAAKNIEGKRAWWWLRSPGHIPDGAALVDYGGDLLVTGFSVSSSGGVRPAFWLNLQS